MKKKLLALGTALLIIAVFAGPLPVAAQSNGTLVFDVKNYASQVKIKKKVAKQLKHAGLKWGMLGNVLIIPMVSEQFVKPTMSNLTRYGEQTVLELEPGEYKITCIGFEHKKTSRDPDKVLGKSAYFNEAIMTFHVLPGKTTTLEILPTYRKQKTFMTTMLMPDLSVKVSEDGVEKAEAVVNLRTSTSVPWNDYSGPLKF